ncbi:MAG: hypothetical protein ACRDF4_00095 [Rhabdochlamydiaceae bacterium]
MSYAAFMPSRKTMDASVYRTSQCSEARVWLLGSLFVEQGRTDNNSRSIIARGDIFCRSILGQGLKIAATSKPHPRHAVITGWPEDKAQQKIWAMALAQNASLVRR